MLIIQMILIAWNTLLLPREFVMFQRMNVIAGRNEALTADCGTGGRVLGENILS